MQLSDVFNRIQNTTGCAKNPVNCVGYVVNEGLTFEKHPLIIVLEDIRNRKRFIAMQF